MPHARDLNLHDFLHLQQKRTGISVSCREVLPPFLFLNSKSSCEDEKVEDTQCKCRKRGGKRILYSDAGDDPEKHHRRQTARGKEKDRTIKMSNDNSEAGGDLQYSREHAETGKTVAFEFRHHAF